METISQLGSVIELTVFFNLMPAITGLCSSVFFPQVTILMDASEKQFGLHSLHAGFSL